MSILNKYDMYEFIIEKMILRKMKEENDAINCSLKKVQEFIRSNGSILAKTTAKRCTVGDTMEQKFQSYSSLSDYYKDMKADIQEIESDIGSDAIPPTYTHDPTDSAM